MNRREILKLSAASLLSATSPSLLATAAPDAASIPQYDIFELLLHGPSSGNPFLDTQLTATFTLGHRSITVDGFYDGDGLYKIRFMPDTEGRWTFLTASNAATLTNHSGSFLCTPATSHGPVSVRYRHHFAYADGTPYFPFGTTCYAWVHQGDTLEQQTLDALRTAPFNKIRMCVFPKSYEYNHNEPQFYPFPRPAGTPLSQPGDTTRFEPAFFHHLELRLTQLRDLNIEADLILFHPYDRWGYSTMPAEVDQHSVRYLVARLAAFRHIWWSLANEYDLMKAKTTQDFTNLLHLVQQIDPYQHLRSIHYSVTMYDYASPAVTHASLQSSNFASTAAWLADWNKPILFDEMMYEGDLPQRWGNLSGEEMTRRFWMAIISGCYATHGETYLNHAGSNDEDDKIWWSNGGKLSGTSPARIAFLRKLLESTTTHGLEAPDNPYYLHANSPLQTHTTPNAIPSIDLKAPPQSILYFLDFHQPIRYDFPLGEATYTAELIDPWAMTITPIPGTHTGKATLTLPGKPFHALRFKRT
jgi:hypothetical protein